MAPLEKRQQLSASVRPLLAPILAETCPAALHRCLNFQCLGQHLQERQKIPVYSFSETRISILSTTCRMLWKPCCCVGGILACGRALHCPICWVLWCAGWRSHLLLKGMACARAPPSSPLGGCLSQGRGFARGCVGRASRRLGLAPRPRRLCHRHRTATVGPPALAGGRWMPVLVRCIPYWGPPAGPDLAPACPNLLMPGHPRKDRSNHHLTLHQYNTCLCILNFGHVLRNSCIASATMKRWGSYRCEWL